MVGVMAILVGGGLAAYRNFDERQRVEAAGKGLVLFLRTAQKKATAADTGTCTLPLESYSVSYGGIEADMNRNCTLGTTVDTFELTDFGQDVTFVGSGSLAFEVLAGSLLSGGDVTIELGTSSYTYQVEVDAGGAISDLGML